MKVCLTSIEAYGLAFVSPLHTANATLRERCGYFCSVSTLDDSFSSVGEVAPLPGWSTETLSEVKIVLESLIGSVFDIEPDAFLREGLGDTERRLCGYHAAICHGVESAILEILAQREGLPVAALLNYRYDSVLPYCQMVQSFQAGVDFVVQGGRAVKLKVSHGTVAEDIERVSQMRQEVGQLAEIRVDANCGWELAEARQFIEGVVGQKVSLLEEPLQNREKDGLRSLSSSIKLAADESVRTHAELEDIGSEGIYGVVVLKPMLCGGPIQVLKMARRSRELGLEFVITTSFETGLGRSVAIHTSAACGLEGQLPGGLNTSSVFASDPWYFPKGQSGFITIPNQVGLGVRREIP
ncbi:MAG: o-succinylbenzoate synthase [Myxococcota bacterium]|nr:o-succinylbenzoate synthase [Myxococcota bacterium]